MGVGIVALGGKTHGVQPKGEHSLPLSFLFPLEPRPLREAWQEDRRVSEKAPRQVVKDLVLGFMEKRPAVITLKMGWGEDWSSITFKGNGLDEKVDCTVKMSFTAFGCGVVDAFRETFGELVERPVSFRETIYENEKVVLDLYPTGSAGIFDIYVSYK